MKQLLFALLIISYTLASAQTIALRPSNLKTLGVTVEPVVYKGKDALKVVQTKDTDFVYTCALLQNIDFHNGTIEAYVSGEPKAEAFQGARGFVGISFRVSADTSHSETFYIRPTNGRAEEQERRNHSLQYISHPGYPWQRLRKETPERYESYADLIPTEWTKIKIVVHDQKALLYVNDASQPNLIVNDLKQGKDLRGSIALWIAVGTKAYFADLKVFKED